MKTTASRGEARYILAVLLLLVGLVVSLVGLAYREFRALSHANRWSVHTYRVLSATEELQQALAEIQSAYRGYALTGDPRHHRAWLAGQAKFTERLVTARRLTTDNPTQQARLAEAAHEYARWIAMQRASGVPDASAPELRQAAIAAAGDPVASMQRQLQAEAVRQRLSAAQAEESGLLLERSARASVLEDRTEGLILGGGILAAAMALAVGVLVRRRDWRLREANHALKLQVAETERAKAALAHFSRQDQLILEAAADGIYGVDADGYTRFLNPAAARMLGMDPEDLVGRPVGVAFRPRAAQSDGSAGEHPVVATLRDGVPRRAADASLRRNDGTTLPVEYSVTPIVEDGGITGAVVLFRDVTVRREVERMKDEFISVVSHELRTPLTSIRGSLGLLASGKVGEVSPRGKRMLDIAVQNTDRLVRLINDILDIERIESGSVTMEIHPVAAAELAQQAAEVMHALAERSGVGLFARAGRGCVLADSDRILQVLTNLLSNAVKFSEPGSEVTLTVSPVGDEVLFQVRDRGRGIPEDRLESVFERFHQVDSSDAREKGGTGLGLAISRTIVQQHGGRIWVESEPGEGSTFSFTLPAVEAAAAHDASQDGEGPLVLVVDDEPDVRGAAAWMLERWGYRTRAAADGESAVWEAIRSRPDAILLDMRLPGMSGAETLHALRDDPRTRDIPVVVLSVLAPTPRLLQSGAVSKWLEKPAREESLLHAVEAAVGQIREPGRVLLVEDDPDLVRVLLAVFERHGIGVTHARTGREAVEVSRTTRPDLVVLDLGLPDGDGYWVVECLRGVDGMQAAPLVVYTARELDAADRERLRLGATEFVTKGRVAPGEFERRVVALLNQITPRRRRGMGSHDGPDHTAD